ncbi:transporter [Thermoplasma volcanium GSS1]|uniref:Transporter n=1 Tax=Thermoplasma volcanium (strain ATCC 51530 / DSM 4299 / JCM 9571 / NBRC 15438 / GSS1) TaxID=273116 RepID=Q97A96_THEVO|nr:MFS transporter [Thermoplasma volcanium]BAB60056.1 transporter [Thermoplasma volcanium GSS1]
MQSTRNIVSNNKIWMLIIFVVGAIPALVSDFDGSAYTYAAPYILSRISLPTFYFGILISGYAAGIAIFSLVGGFMFDRFSPKSTVVYSVLLFSIFTILTGYSTNAIELVISRVLVGFGVGMFQSASVSFLGDANPETRGAGVMVWGVLAGLGTFIAPYIILPFLPNYRIPFLISGILGFIVAAVFYFVVPPVFKKEEKLKNPFRHVLNRYSVFPMVSMFFFGFTLLGLLGYYSDFLSSVVGFGKTSVAIIISFLGVGGVIFGIPAGIFSDMVGRKIVLIIAITLISISMLAITYAPRDLILFLLATLAFGTGWSIFSILSPATGQDMVRDEAVGSVSGAILMTFNIGGIIGPLMIGLILAKGFTLRAGFLYFIDIPAILALLLTIAMKYPKNIKEIVKQQLLEDASISK